MASAVGRPLIDGDGEGSVEGSLDSVGDDDAEGVEVVGSGVGVVRVGDGVADVDGAPTGRRVSRGRDRSARDGTGDGSDGTGSAVVGSAARGDGDTATCGAPPSKRPGIICPTASPAAAVGAPSRTTSAA
ncbi:hypothetical protein [Actinomadura decatromicini]|uniref:Uncharacterized protein n=1 Tax=Actinomadura decatromicini TaxID=2604572 RepID=A0A5D3FAH7_9ACTN|nr:hypothetical protein [Actinomadura decatromicini]TYK45213.1 hypothetical protein FXF68_31545 [Actinomadura decatromicini]